MKISIMENKFSSNMQEKMDQCYYKPIEIKKLKSAVSYLNHADKKKSSKRHCLHKNKHCWDHHQSTLHNQSITLKSRHARYIEEELRKAVLRHDWESCGRLLVLLIKTGIRRHLVVIIKVCSLLMFHHPSMVPDLLGRFLNSTTNYMDDPDVEEFILLILTLRQSLLYPVTTNVRSAVKVIHNTSYGIKLDHIGLVI